MHAHDGGSEQLVPIVSFVRDPYDNSEREAGGNQTNPNADRIDDEERLDDADDPGGEASDDT
jgi:hypothetical protein